jgi:type I restriction enzyme M protein
MKKISIEELKSFLWSSADILRGSIDADKFKDYIFVLLFIKRLNDTFEEESKKIIEKYSKEGYSDEEIQDEVHDPMNYEESFYIPESAMWSLIKDKKENIGETINEMSAAIEGQEGNERLKDILTEVDFNDKKKLSDSKLEKLVNHFSKVVLCTNSFEDPDAMGLAYEYLIEQFAGSAGKSAGEFFTPKEIVKLLVDVVGVEAKNKVMDPTCGSGGILMTALDYVKKNNDKAGTISIYGQELNHSTMSMCVMNMFLHGQKDFDVRQGDTLAEPKHLDKDNNLMKFDRVLANPPYSIKEWEDDKFNSDAWGRNKYGEVPSKNADFAFVQHILGTLEEDGKAGIVLPHGVLFRSGKEAKIREALLKDDKIEAIIGLPEKLFFNTGIAVCIIVLNNKKDKNMKNKVMFVNAELMFNSGKNQNTMSDEHRSEITSAYKKRKDESRFCKLVDLKEIKENDYNLNIKRYCDTAPPAEIFEVQGILTGGIPQVEIDNEYNQELLALSGVKALDILKKKGDRYFVKLSDEELDKKDLDEKTLDMINKWKDKYEKTLVDAEKECVDLGVKLNAYLKELGYDK